jgi:hypothetical protein
MISAFRPSGFLVLIVLGLAGGGCRGQDPPSSVGTPREGATNVQSVFRNAPEGVRQQADDVAAAVQSQDAVGAYARLENLSGQTALTPEQKQAIANMRLALLRSLQAESERGNAAAEELLNRYRASK